MWQFGPEGLFNIWESEKVTGSPQRSRLLHVAYSTRLGITSGGGVW